jgi:hypothetical protein
MRSYAKVSFSLVALMFLLVVTAAFGAESSPSPYSEADKQPRPGILKAAPARVRFGKVRVITTKAFTLSNKGGVDVTGTVGTVSAPFWISAGGGAFDLTPGQSIKVSVEFAPLTKGNFRQILLISSNAKKGARLKIHLSGKAATAVPAPACASGIGCLTLGTKEDHLLDQGQFGVFCFPDEHMTFMRQSDNSNRFWIAGGATPQGGGAAVASAIGLTTDDFASFMPLTLYDGNAVAGLGPSGPGTENFDADYVGPGTVITASNGTDLLMFYHAENHLFNGVHYEFSPFYSSIGIARSTDNGLTWNRVGQVITGVTPKPTQPPPGALGAAGPSVIVAQGYIYLFYLDVGNYDLFPDVVHVARAPVASDGAPGSWLKYYQGAFTEPGLGGMSTPVQNQVAPDDITKGAFWPDVSYNSCLGRFLMVFQTADGYYYSTSADLVTWTLQDKIFSFSPDIDPNGPWYGYQTLISTDQPNERVTSCSGFLYYAKRANFSAVCQSMYRRPFFFGPPVAPSEGTVRGGAANETCR